MRVITAVMAVLGISLIASGNASAGAPSVFPPSIEPPAVLSTLRPGMTLAEARTALRSFELDASYADAAKRTRMIKDAGGGTLYYVLVAHDVIARIGIEAPERGLIATLTKRWGKPATAVNAAREGLLSWEAAGWRVDLACRQARCRLAFHRALEARFFGTKVSPPGPLAAIKLGMTRDELAAIAPAFAGGAEVPAGPEDVRLSVDAKEGRVRSIAIAGLPPTAGELLRRAWGPATIIASRPTWFDPHAGWRARYDATLQLVQLTEYMPVMALLGRGDKLALPLFGMSAKQLAKTYPRFQVMAGGGTLALPATEFASTLTTIAVHLDPHTGKVSRATFALPFDSPAHEQMLLAVLEGKWGKPQAYVTHGTRRLRFPSSRARVEVTVGAAELVIDLR